MQAAPGCLSGRGATAHPDLHWRLRRERHHPGPGGPPSPVSPATAACGAFAPEARVRGAEVGGSPRRGPRNAVWFSAARQNPIKNAAG
eukprot:113205-Alexandrium_andersonii.AAC.1